MTKYKYNARYISHGSNRGKYIKENYQIRLKYASRHCQNGNQEINRYPRKTHATFSMSTEFKCKKVPNISDRNKQRNYRYFTLVLAHTMTVKTVSFCMIIRQ